MLGSDNTGLDVIQRNGWTFISLRDAVDRHIRDAGSLKTVQAAHLVLSNYEQHPIHPTFCSGTDITGFAVEAAVGVVNNQAVSKRMSNIFGGTGN